MTLANEYKKQMLESYASALRSIVTPNTTAKAIRSLVEQYPDLADLSLSQILGDAAGGKRKARGKGKGKAKPATKAPKQGRGRSKRWNVRSPDGRKALSAAVLDALAELGGKEVAAQAIRAKLGATPAQIRTTLNRHIEAGKVTFSGKARGTRYSLA